MKSHVRCGHEVGPDFGQEKEDERQSRNDSSRGHGHTGSEGVIVLILEYIRLGAHDPAAIDPVVEESVRVEHSPVECRHGCRVISGDGTVLQPDRRGDPHSLAVESFFRRGRHARGRLPCSLGQDRSRSPCCRPSLLTTSAARHPPAFSEKLTASRGSTAIPRTMSKIWRSDR